MRYLLLLTALLSGCAQGQTVNHVTINEPIPKQYQQARTVVLHEFNQDQIDRQCGKGGISPDGQKITTIGCGDINGNDIYLPNSCTYPEVNDVNSYAHAVCHEVAHTEGWVHKF